MVIASAIVAWLIVGYLFAFWFINYFLDDQSWADTGERVGLVSIFFLTVVGPIMAALFIGSFVIWHVLNFIFGGTLGNAIKRLYGVKVENQ